MAQPGADKDAKSTIRGSCFCKAVSYAFTGAPVLSAYCHCTNCQRLNGCPFVHTMHIPAAAFTWTHDSSEHDLSEALDVYVIPSKPHKSRFRCKVCGACVAGYNTVRERYSVWGAQLEVELRVLASGGGSAGGQSGENSEEGGESGLERKTWSAVWEVVKPTAHIFYGTRILDVRDELGKWKGYEGESEKIGDH